MGSVWSHWLSVKHTLQLLFLLPFKEHQQALHNSVACSRGGQWDIQRWPGQIKLCVLERWTKSKHHEIILTFVVWTWECLCMLVSVPGFVCVVWQKEQVSAKANQAATQVSPGTSYQHGHLLLSSYHGCRSGVFSLYSKNCFSKITRLIKKKKHK